MNDEPSKNTITIDPKAKWISSLNCLFNKLSAAIRAEPNVLSRLYTPPDSIEIIHLTDNDEKHKHTRVEFLFIKWE